MEVMVEKRVTKQLEINMWLDASMRYTKVFLWGLVKPFIMKEKK